MAKKKEKETKTNAIRMIETAGIPYREHTYDVSDGFTDGMDAARATGVDPGRSFKTLVLTAGPAQFYVCAIPVSNELDLKKAARHFGVKKLEMLHLKDLVKITGYVHGGCSPVGMKKLFPTAIDETAQLFDTISVSGGKLGLSVELDPEALAELCGASFADLVKS